MESDARRTGLVEGKIRDNSRLISQVKVLTAIGNFCICSIVVGMLVEIVIMYLIQQRKYRDGNDNMLVFLIGRIPIAMHAVLSVTMAIELRWRAGSSAGAYLHVVQTNIGSIDWLDQGQGSKAGSLSCVGSHQPKTSLSTSASGSALGSSQPTCRPWERGDLLRRMATFKLLNWFGKPKI